MKLPRDLSGEDLASLLRRNFNYQLIRQRGSHMTLSVVSHGAEHHVTIPRHQELRVGTLSSTVPLSISVRLFTSLGAGAQNPVNCINKTETLFLLPCVGTRVSLQKRQQFLPLMVGNSLRRHPPVVANVTKLIERLRTLIRQKLIRKNACDLKPTQRSGAWLKPLREIG